MAFTINWELKITLLTSNLSKSHHGYEHSHLHTDSFIKTDGGFFFVCEDFGRMFNNSFSACIFFFFLMEISLCTLIPLFMPGLVHSGSGSSDNCDQVFPDELNVSSFPERVPTLCLDSGIVSPHRLHWVKGVCMFRCSLPPAL